MSDLTERLIERCVAYERAIGKFSAISEVYSGGYPLTRAREIVEELNRALEKCGAPKVKPIKDDAAHKLAGGSP